MKFNVTGDGGRHGTRVFTEDGADISKQVSAVRYTHEVGSDPVVEVDINLPEVGFPGEGKVYFGGREISRIIYADGGEEIFDA